jgi:hypothetical protein
MVEQWGIVFLFPLCGDGRIITAVDGDTNWKCWEW